MPLQDLNVSGSYFYAGNAGLGAPATGSGVPYVGRGPVDSFIIGGVTLSATLQPTDGSTDVEVVSLSGTEFSNSSSFSGSDYTVVFGPQEVEIYGNLAITLINNSENNLESGSVEFSPNNSQWETDWDVTTFAALSSSAVRSMQISSNSRRYLRIRAISSGSGGALTGSLDIYLNTNTG